MDSAPRPGRSTDPARCPPNFGHRSNPDPRPMTVAFAGPTADPRGGGAARVRCPPPSIYPPPRCKLPWCATTARCRQVIVCRGVRVRAGQEHRLDPGSPSESLPPDAPPPTSPTIESQRIIPSLAAELADLDAAPARRSGPDGRRVFRHRCEGQQDAIGIPPAPLPAPRATTPPGSIRAAAPAHRSRGLPRGQVRRRWRHP
jgi:hypothetical protein